MRLEQHPGAAAAAEEDPVERYLHVPVGAPDLNRLVRVVRVTDQLVVLGPPTVEGIEVEQNPAAEVRVVGHEAGAGQGPDVDDPAGAGVQLEVRRAERPRK